MWHRYFVPGLDPMYGISTGFSVSVGTGGYGDETTLDVLEGGSNATLELSARQLVDLLADPMYSAERKESALGDILALGTEAIPALIAHISDGRLYAYRSSGAVGSPSQRAVTVGNVCEELLYQLVTPDHQSPHERPIENASPVFFTVVDWPSWWARNRHLPLEAIRDELRPVIDRYWLEGGVEQQVR